MLLVSSIVDKDIEFAKLLDRFLNERSAVLELADVAGD
jgi:hypothetical protein